MEEDKNFITLHKGGNTWVVHDSVFQKEDEIKNGQLKENEQQNYRRNHEEEIFRLERRIKDLPDYNGNKKEVPNILSYDKELNEEKSKEFYKRSERGNLPEPIRESVYVDMIKTSQPYLNRNKLLKFAGIQVDNKESIHGVRYKGNIILTDGNHRVALAKLRSQSKIEMDIVDLDRKVSFLDRLKRKGK